MTTRQFCHLLAIALLVGGALLAVLAVVHHYAMETEVLFFDDLGNKVHVQAGRDVTFLMFSLAGVLAATGGFLAVAAREPSGQQQTV